MHRLCGGGVVPRQRFRVRVSAWHIQWRQRQQHARHVLIMPRGHVCAGKQLLGMPQLHGGRLHVLHWRDAVHDVCCGFLWAPGGQQRVHCVRCGAVWCGGRSERQPGRVRGLLRGYLWLRDGSHGVCTVRLRYLQYGHRRHVRRGRMHQLLQGHILDGGWNGSQLHGVCRWLVSASDRGIPMRQMPQRHLWQCDGCYKRHPVPRVPTAVLHAGCGRRAADAVLLQRRHVRRARRPVRGVRPQFIRDGAQQFGMHALPYQLLLKRHVGTDAPDAGVHAMLRRHVHHGARRSVVSMQCRLLCQSHRLMRAVPSRQLLSRRGIDHRRDVHQWQFAHGQGACECVAVLMQRRLLLLQQHHRVCAMPGGQLLHRRA